MTDYALFLDLAKEVEPLGIEWTIVEPGPFRTDWAGRSLKTPRPGGPGSTSRVIAIAATLPPLPGSTA